MTGETSAPSAKYDAGAQVTREDFICLHRNENLFAGDAWPDAVVAEVVRGVALENYPDPTYLGLRADLGELWGVGPENVFLGNGSDEVLSDLLGLLRDRYDTLHLQDACFRVYYLLAARFGFGIETLPGDTFSTDRIEVDGRARLAVVDSPNAITGRSATREELLGLSQPAGSFLVWDNAYGEFSPNDSPIPWADNVVVVRSFSKFYALAGARVGYCIADSAVVRELMDRKDVFNINALGCALARAAVRRREEFQPLVEETTRCRTRLVEYLEENGFFVHPPSANYVLATHESHSALAIQAGLHARGVAVRRFDGPLTGNSLRITVPPWPILNIFQEHLSEVMSAI